MSKIVSALVDATPAEPLLVAARRCCLRHIEGGVKDLQCLVRRFLKELSSAN